MDCNLSIIFNKVDLVENNDHQLQIYQKLDYPVVMISAKEKTQLRPIG